MKRLETTKKLLAVLLSILVAVTFLPLVNSYVYAEEGEDAIEEQSDMIAPEENLVENNLSEDIELEEENQDVENSDVENDSQEEDSTEVLPEKNEADFVPDTVYEKKAVVTPSVPSDAYSVSITSSSNKLTIEGSVPDKYTHSPYNYVFGQLFVDGIAIKDFTGSTVIQKQSISLSQFDTGYHTAFLQLYDKSTSNLVRMIFKEKLVVNKITAKPTYKGVFEVYSKKFNYYPYNMALENQSGPLYMEYKPSSSKTWKRTGKMQANAIKLYIEQGFVIKGLKSNKKYNTRIRYGTYVSYTKLSPADFGLTLEEFQKVFGTTKTSIGDGKSYFFGGPALTTTGVKTGKAKKPSIKSVKVKATNVKFHKHRVAGHYEWTGYHYIWIGPYTEKYYTCKYKVTTKLKKKPGTKGIWVNGKFLKGNKKTYTTTFTPYPNYFTKKPPKGLKYKVKIKSYQAKSYGGFSPTYSKTKKVK